MTFSSKTVRRLNELNDINNQLKLVAKQSKDPQEQYVLTGKIFMNYVEYVFMEMREAYRLGSTIDQVLDQNVYFKECEIENLDQSGKDYWMAVHSLARVYFRKHYLMDEP